MTTPPQTADERNPYDPPRAAIGPRHVAVAVRRSIPRVIVLSFLITSALGGWFLDTYWSLEGRRALGPVRGAGFVAIMAGVHFVGDRIDARQPGGAGT
jgi:hypothetical protein